MIISFSSIESFGTERDKVVFCSKQNTAIEVAKAVYDSKSPNKDDPKNINFKGKDAGTFWTIIRYDNTPNVLDGATRIDIKKADCSVYHYLPQTDQ